MIASTLSFRVIEDLKKTIVIVGRTYGVYRIRAGRSKCIAYIPIEDAITEYACVKSSNAYVTKDYLDANSQEFALRVENARILKEEFFTEPEYLEVKCCGKLIKAKKDTGSKFVACTLRMKSEDNQSFYVLMTATKGIAVDLLRLPDKSQLCVQSRIFSRLYEAGLELNITEIRSFVGKESV